MKHRPMGAVVTGEMQLVRRCIRTGRVLGRTTKTKNTVQNAGLEAIAARMAGGGTAWVDGPNSGSAETAGALKIRTNVSAGTGATLRKGQTGISTEALTTSGGLVFRLTDARADEAYTLTSVDVLLRNDANDGDIHLARWSNFTSGWASGVKPGSEAWQYIWTLTFTLSGKNFTAEDVSDAFAFMLTTARGGATFGGSVTDDTGTPGGSTPAFDQGALVTQPGDDSHGWSTGTEEAQEVSGTASGGDLSVTYRRHRAGSGSHPALTGEQIRYGVHDLGYFYPMTALNPDADQAVHYPYAITIAAAP
ncbi:MAG: hypothetical protein OXH68_15210 [Gammaproteobacteria bacterium]|nr:hypothetical protein [Gammaproteobacteria bacterium]